MNVTSTEQNFFGSLIRQLFFSFCLFIVFLYGFSFFKMEFEKLAMNLLLEKLA